MKEMASETKGRIHYWGTETGGSEHGWYEHIYLLEYAQQENMYVWQECQSETMNVTVFLQSSYRNAVIAAAANRCGYDDKQGTGVRRAVPTWGVGIRCRTRRRDEKRLRFECMREKWKKKKGSKGQLNYNVILWASYQLLHSSSPG